MFRTVPKFWDTLQITLTFPYLALSSSHNSRILHDGTCFRIYARRNSDPCRIQHRTVMIYECNTAPFATFCHNRSTVPPSLCIAGKALDGTGEYTYEGRCLSIMFYRRLRHKSAQRLYDSIQALPSYRRSKGNPPGSLSSHSDTRGTSNHSLKRELFAIIDKHDVELLSTPLLTRLRRFGPFLHAFQMQNMMAIGTRPSIIQLPDVLATH